MNENKGVQLGAVLMAILIISMAFVPVVSATTTVEKATQIQTIAQSSCGNGTCSACGSGNITNISRLDKEELGKDLQIALDSSEVKKLKKELESRGLNLSLDNVRGLNVTKIDGTLAEGLVLPFISQDNTEAGILTEVDKHKVVKAVAVLIYKNDTKFPVSVEQLSINQGKIVSEKVDVSSILNSGVSIQYTSCDACKDLYGVACAVGCGLDMALLCLLAGITTIIGGLACTVVAAVVCYFIGVYGCGPEATDFCRWIGYC